MTYGDFFRSMSDEQICDYLMGFCFPCDEKIGKPPYCDGKSNCKPCIMAALKEEVPHETNPL